LATLVAAPPEGDEWIAEVKYDGYRAVIALDDGRARVFTRNHADWTDRFGPLGKAAEALPAESAVIDGEVVVFDADGVSRFGLLQEALGSHPERLAFAAFDLQYLNGYDLRGLPLLQRKELLRSLLDAEPGGSAPSSPLHFAEHVTGASAEFFRQACLADLEGIVCKRGESHYVPGRGRDWQKLKCRQTQELVVGGFTEGAGSRTGLGSLLVGVYDGDRLLYAGRVGTGFDEAGLAAMRARLEPLERDTPAFSAKPRVSGHVVHWTEPTLVIEAAFREWTADGHLRQPVYLGVREDKDPLEVVREAPATSAPAATADPADAPDAPAGAKPDPKPRSAGRPGARADFGADTAVLGVTVTNPGKTLFPDSPLTKFEFAEYYATIAPLMLAETAGRPLTLMRCPVGHGRGCFYQRHPDAGLSPHIHVLPHTIKGEPFELLYVDSAEGLVALAQMGAVEVHTWLSRIDALTRPDRLVFDLDPGPDVSWPQIVATARLVREECAGLGFEPFLKSTGSKGLHVVLPIEPVWEFDRVRAFAKALADKIAARHPDALTTKMAKSQRGGRVFFDYLRNAEGASAVAGYSTRNLSGPSCAIPLAWAELTDTLDERSFTPHRVLERISETSDPWSGIEDSAAGAKVLRRAESGLAR
jgi:bifunctional non-homologous end joining protein LigD